MSTGPAPDWLFCGLTAPTGLILPNERASCGTFEFTKVVDPIPGCEAALADSAKAFGESVDLGQSFLLKTFFLGASSVGEVIRSARLYAREALALYTQCLPFSITLTLRRSGYVVNMSNLAVSPILPTAREHALGMAGTVVVLDELASHPLEIVNRLLVSDPQVFGELGAAVRRSTHWSEMVRRLEDDGERFLFQWMACETLTRVNESESLTPKLMSALGLATGRYLIQLPVRERNPLQRCVGYMKWRPPLNDLFDKLRDMRNHIAHSGYRELEIAKHLSHEEYKLAPRVLPMVVARLQGLALVGLQRGIDTIAQLWERYAECKLQHRQISLADEVDKTIAVWLTDPAFSDE